MRETDDHPRHPDILTAEQAAKYLALDEAATSMPAAIRLLERLKRDGRIRALRWAKSHLYHRLDLNEFVADELAALGDRARGTARRSTEHDHNNGDVPEIADDERPGPGEIT